MRKADNQSSTHIFHGEGMKLVADGGQGQKNPYLIRPATDKVESHESLDLISQRLPSPFREGDFI
jgi:hypothetical protein